jgi:hypothetical protein
MLTLEIITWLVMTYPRCHPESPHVPAAFLATTDRDVAPMSPKYSPDTHHVLTRSPKEKTKETPETPETPTTTQEAIFLGGFLFSQKQTAKASEEQNKTWKKADPETPETTTEEAIFFWVFFCFHKSKRQKPQKNKTKHGKKQTQKYKRKNNRGRKRKPISRGGLRGHRMQTVSFKRRTSHG